MSVSAPAAGTAAPASAARHGRAEIMLAIAAFAVMCVVVLRVAPQLVEPDDYAYRASIVAATEGHLLSLTTAQLHALSASLAPTPGSGQNALVRPGPLGGSIAQWVRLPDGRWISEKNPGYSFLAAPFQALGIIRLAPLFYGALACLGLFAGARRWLGRFGGAAAVILYCSSGAALLFAWRDYMPTFTDASLIAAGTGVLLWAVLAHDAPSRLRTWVGLLGFLALEAAAFTRYTDIIVLGCAIVAVLAVRWGRPQALPLRALRWWLGSAVLFVAGVAVFDDFVYGGPMSSGYRREEIRFGLGSILPNLRYMPSHLIQSMPMLALGVLALGWIGLRWLRLRTAAGDEGGAARRDGGVALSLAASWLGIWGLYAMYNWTAGPGLSTLQSVRFYLPACGAIALLGAWLVTRLPRRTSLAAVLSAVVVAAAFGSGIGAFTDMARFRLGPPHTIIGHPRPQRPSSG